VKYIIIRPYYGTTVSGDTAGDFGHMDLSGNVTPDMGLVLGASAMHKFGKEVIVYDNNATKTFNSRFFEEIIVGDNDEFIIKSCLSTFYCDVLFAKELKERYPMNKIHFVGHIAIQMSDWIRDNCRFIDYIANEKTEVYLYKIGKDADISDVTINDFPTVNYRLFPYMNYQERFGKNIAYLLSSDGCTNGCLYCPYKMLHRSKMAYRDIEKIIDDLKEVLGLGISLVQFRDPYFTYDRDRVINLCTRIIEEQIEIDWYCETYATSLDADLVKLMKKAGCKLIMFGIESAKVEQLKQMGRKADDYTIYKSTVDMIADIGVDTMGFYIIGMNNDTLDDLNDTYFLSERLNTTFVQYSVFIDYQQTINAMRKGDYQYFVPLSNSMYKSKCNIPQRDLVNLSGLLEFVYYLRRFGLKKEYELLKYFEAKIKLNDKSGKKVIEKIDELLKNSNASIS